LTEMEGGSHSLAT